MAQCLDVPTASFESFRESLGQDNILKAERIGDLTRVTQAWTGHRVADVQQAMDENRARAEALGGQERHRTRIGRNTPCPCGSGRKFKKCCIPRSALVGLSGAR